MQKKKKKFDKVKLLGRDPTFGKTSFKTGAILTPKDKLRIRNSKLAKRQKRKELEGDD